MTDQTKKREEGVKRVNRAAVIVAPTGSGDEERGKKGMRTADTICRVSSIPGYGQGDSTRVNPEKKGSRNRERGREKRERKSDREREYSYYVQRARRDASFFFLRRRVFRIGRVELDD